MTNKYIMSCPVCESDVEWFDICDKCNYQNSGPKEEEEDLCDEISVCSYIE